MVTEHFSHKTFGTGVEVSDGHFRPGPQVSGQFDTNLVVPKCLVAEVSGSAGNTSVFFGKGKKG